MCLRHAGNILVRIVDPNSLWGRITYFLNIPTAPRLVLLDAGMTAELTRQDQMNLVKFFRVWSFNIDAGASLSGMLI